MTPKSIRVAVVDDDPSVRKALGRVLSIADFEVETFASARELLAAQELRAFNCLVIDLQMPEISGLELLGQLHDAGVTIPSILITAHSNGGNRERCKSAGAVAFLLKPFGEGALVRAINAAVNSYGQ
jgi:FixJ family two-component response regulator